MRDDFAGSVRSDVAIPEKLLARDDPRRALARDRHARRAPRAEIDNDSNPNLWAKP
jgi:hypothetical protein